MDYNFDFRNPYQSMTFYSVEGTIVDMEPTRIGNRKADGCQMFVSIEDMDGNIVNFIVTPSTYVVDYTMLREGMKAVFYYRADAPAPLIYPPQYNAAVVVPDRRDGKFISVGYFNNSLMNEDRTLQLNMNNRVRVVTTNNQVFLGSPADHNLVVTYETTTRSIPAQTTPEKIVVLCGQ